MMLQSCPRKGEAKTMKSVCMTVLVVLFSLASFGVNDVTPDKLDGNELAASCRESTQGFDAGYCLGVIEGVISTSKTTCTRTTITLADAAFVVDQYLTDNPTKLNKRDAILVRDALAKKYHCGLLGR